MADSPEEKAHWHSVLKAFDGYMQYHVRPLAHLNLSHPNLETPVISESCETDGVPSVAEGS